MVRREGRESESESEREEKRRRERVSSVHQNDTHGPVRVMTLWSVMFGESEKTRGKF